MCVVQVKHVQVGPIVKSTVLAYQAVIQMPHLLNAVIATKELVVQTYYHLSKS